MSAPDSPGDGLYTDRRRALSFGAVADSYDRLRPRYAEAAVDRLAALGGHDAVDVGAGTGILARQLRDRGLTVLAVEPDPAMADVTRHSGIPAEVATFESWAPAGRTFDLVTFGQSWHWVDPAAGIPKLRDVVRAGGHVALLWNTLRTTRPTTAELHAASPDYVTVNALSQDPHRSDAGVTELLATLTRAGFDVTTATDRWTERQDRERWLDLVFTYSAHLALPSDRQAALRTALSDAIGTDTIELEASTLTVLATLPAG